MRSISAAEEAVLSATGGRSTRFRVKVKDSGGTFRDLSTYGGQNFCLEATWKEDVDSPGMDADITLKRAVEKFSLAPLMTGSPLNLAFAYPGTYAKLIDIGREVQIDVAVGPADFTPASGDWKLAFHGYIDETDPGNETLTLRCSDLQAKLRDTWIERERVYAFAQGANATKGCCTWRAAETHAVGARGIPTDARKNGHYYRVTSITTGITGSSEPTWPTGGGATVVDGGVTWTESGSTSDSAGTAVETVMQQILDDNIGGITLSVPSSPSWQIKAYKLDRQSVWDALRQLVDQLGWDLRYKWDSGSSSFKLTFYEPDRAKTTPDRTIGPSQRYKLTQLKTDISGIRNAVQVVYDSVADRDAGGKVPRKTVIRTNSSSIAAYGRRFCEVSEASSMFNGGTSNIDSGTEAEALADNILSDLANPVADHICDVPLFRHVELGDLIRWSADGIHYDNDQDLAVTGYQHRIDGKRAVTNMRTRGKPSAGFMRWHRKLNKGLHGIDAANVTNSFGVITSDVVGGIKVAFNGNQPKNALQQHAEFHVSDTPGFTPSSGTLVAQGAADALTFADGVPGQTYYSVIIPYVWNHGRLVKGQPSEEFSFVAGRASAGHISEGIALGAYPLNGGFETRKDTSGMPDHWHTIGCVVGDDILVKEDGSGLSGGRYLRLQPSVGSSSYASAYTAQIPVLNEQADASTRYAGLYRCTAWVKNATSNNAANNLEIFCRGYDYAGGLIGVVASVLVNAATKTGHWHRVEWMLNLDADADYRSVDLGFEAPHTSGQFIVDLDEVRVEYLGTPWYAVGDTSKYTDNYESIPAFGSGWSNWGSPNEACAFRRDSKGRVHIKGLAASATNTTGTGNKVFQLPTGFRPPYTIHWASVGNGKFAGLEVDASGNVYCGFADSASYAAYFSIACSFETY